jgi:hypothetical protein
MDPERAEAHLRLLAAADAYPRQAPLHVAWLTLGLAVDGLGDLTSWPVIWIRDSGGWRHATGAGDSADEDREVTMEAAVVPRLGWDTEWIEVIATGTSAEARVTLPVRWG